MNFRRLLPGIAIPAALAVGVGIGTWLTNSPSVESSEHADTHSLVSETTQSHASEAAPKNPDDLIENPVASVVTPLATDALGSNDSISRQIALADEWLSTGYFTRAKAGYYAVMHEVKGSALDGLMFRIALCSELIGEYPQALNEYQRLATKATSSVWSSASRLGEARCLAATGRTELLHTEILPMAILDESSFPVWIVGELLHLAGRTIVPEFEDTTSLLNRQRLLRNDGLAVPGTEVEPEDLLTLMDSRQNETYTASGPPIFKLLQNTGGTPDGCYLQLQQKNVSVRLLIDSILNECGFKVDVSTGANASIGQHGQTLFVTDRSLSLILDGICLKFGLIWKQDGETISLLTRDEAGVDADLVYDHLVGERVLKAAVLSAPDSMHSDASQLTLGVMLFQDQLYADAAHAFQVYLERKPHAALVGVASFNLAKCCLKLQQPTEARKHFLRCIDDNKTTRDLRICAYVNLAELQLADGDTRPAISTLVRSLSQSRGHWSEVDCALMLASAYLLSDNPQGANSVLMDRRALIQLKPHVDAAAFISAYCRFRRAAEPTRVAREAEALVTSLSHIRPASLLGHHWFILTGAAYEEIGLSADAISTYVECLNSDPSEFLMAHCSLRLVDIYLEDGSVSQAAEILKAVPELQNIELRNQTRLKQAKVCQKQGDFKTAMALAEQLALDAEDPAIRKESLRVLGSLYEAMGNPRAAVYCYAGMVPSTEDSPSVEQTSYETPASYDGRSPK